MNELNAEQQAAVLAKENRVLVLAGAGSGKTRTLVQRVAHLMEHGASGYEIVCLAFTRAAAGEMRARLEARIGREARKVTVSTFHGLGLGLLKRYGQHIGLCHGNLTVYTPLEMEALLQHCGELIGLYVKGKWKHGKKPLDAMFAAMEREGRGPEPEHPYAPLMRAFESACRRDNALPYYGLIRGIVELAEAGKVREYTNWKYLLVDEVQDLDPIQWRAIDAILEHTEGSELYAVGDISQSIYGFRGAVPQHLQALISAGELTVYELRSNYRSAPAIVEAANSLIRRNTSHRVLEMRAMRPMQEDAPRALALARGADSAGLAELLADCEWEFPPVILCRNNRMLDKLGEELSARDVPHRRIGRRTSALHSPLFVKANAALKCIVNPFDETAFLLAHKGLGVEADRFARLRLTAADTDRSCFQVFRDEMSEEVRQFLPSAESPVTEARTWLEHHYRHDPADGDAAPFAEWLDAYVAGHPADTIADYLDWLALADVQDEMPAKDEEPAILLMTCQAAKGLEFPTVIIAGCNEGVLPSRQAVTVEKKGDTAAIEDERRLMYVAVTRAMNRLILAVRPEKDALEPPSRFLAELGL